MDLNQNEIEAKLYEVGAWVAKRPQIPFKDIRNGDVLLTRHPTNLSDLVIGVRVPKGLRTFTARGCMIQPTVMPLTLQSNDYGYFALGHISEWKNAKHGELFDKIEILFKEFLPPEALEIIYYDEDITIGDVFLHGDWRTNLCLHVLSGISDSSARVNSLPFNSNLNFPFMRVRQPAPSLKNFFA
jgi:hypothetical protein